LRKLPFSICFAPILAAGGLHLGTMRKRILELTLTEIIRGHSPFFEKLLAANGH
jgi:hypothetical protein